MELGVVSMVMSLEDVASAADVGGIPWGQFSVATGGWLLVSLFVVAMWRGKIVPRTSLDDALHDRDEWRSESRIKDAQIAAKDEQIVTKDQQLGHLREVGEVQKHLLDALGKITGIGQERA